MKLKVIAPILVTEAELVRRQARCDGPAPAGVDVRVVNLPDDPDVPRKLESVDDIVASDRLVVAEISRTGAGEFDAVLPDCVLDAASYRPPAGWRSRCTASLSWPPASWPRSATGSGR